MNKLIKVAVIGSTGYVGLELIYILSKHPNVLIKYLASKSNFGKKINSFDKRLKKALLPKLISISKIKYSEIDVVFFSLPHSISQNIIKKHLGECIFIDLSADFRLNNAKIYKKYYLSEHKSPSLLNDFVYGIPELNYQKIKDNINIAVPGCYPTSILLPLIPLIKNNLIFPKNLIIDSKSGYSGAGKNFNTKKLFSNNNQYNFYNYNTNNHRHIAEIYQELKKVTKLEINFSFNPHILPIFRGMMSTIYCDLKQNISKKDLIKCLKHSYSKNKFIKILSDNQPGDFFSVCNTNYCLIKFFRHQDKKKIIIVSLIDNLIKGASGQAIQCMNIIYGLREDKGLANL